MSASFEYLLSEALSIQTVDEFKKWTRESIRPIFPHETLGCGYGRLHAGGVGIDGIIAIDYPVEHLKHIRNQSGGIDTPILRRWLATREPQLFETASPWPDIPKKWFEHFQRNGLKNVAAHAVYDTARCVGTYFSFHRIPGALNEVHAEILKRLVPVMHEVLCHVIGDLNEKSQLDSLRTTLSARELEVLRLVGQGKINGEIATALFLSEITVKHHLTKIFQKLGVDNRAQLVRLYVEHEARVQSEYGLKVHQ